ncbi:hypothetical protein DCC39_04535 [Pueribacillus theae]|uniref:Competence protein CoiA n=1 Tax=Pueribacillus theae TaxID=2171751 RepID=A0A2U1K5C0_9BACI|nr:competence protein CoiA family protein [Pueribacillus theae]PWA12707.1 hypothetical protein DCC39_04535 [Pueribacillus theae]
MLTAKTKNGKLISLLNEWSHKDLLELNDREAFYCPACGSKVLMKLGLNRRWHFAHKRDSACGSSEAESDYHLNGKEQLYDWLKSQNLNVKLEPYIPKIKQRPDLFLSSPYYTPIEFQCSSISDSHFLKRTRNYMNLRISPIWILGGNRLKRISQNGFQLTKMDWLTLREPENESREPFLFYFCPNAKQFALLTDLVPYSSTKTLAKLSYLNREEASCDDLTQKKLSPIYQFPSNWLQIKTTWRSYSHLKRTPASRYVSKMLQAVSRELSFFPPEAGLPTRYQFWVDTPSYIWQTWLLLQCVHPLRIGQTFRFHDVNRSFQRMLSKQIFTVRKLPLIKKSHYSFAIMDYLLALCDLRILNRTGKTSFVKNSSISLPNTIDEAMHLDKEALHIVQGKRNSQVIT